MRKLEATEITRETGHTRPKARENRVRLLVLAGGFVLFAVAATLNAGGYRYGASDQAFYIPAILHHFDASLFPRDWALLGPQDHLNVFTGAVAAAARVAGLSLPSLFLALYAVGLLALFGTGYGIGSRLYRSGWAVVALVGALTLRHAIALGAVNTLEGYMHPRMIAFGLGGLAVAAWLGRHPARAIVLVLVSAAVHPTTAVWFAVWLGVALVVGDSRLRLPALAAGGLAAAVGAWTVASGPLAGRLVTMDDAWLAVLGPKKYLFPTAWPIDGWLPVVLTPLAVAWLYGLRRSRGLVTPAEHGVAAGAAVLVAIFFASLPFTSARLALAVQLQVSRTLWMVDLLAVAYIVWYLAEGAPWARREGRPGAARVVALVLVALSLARGGYVMFLQHPGRPVVEVGLPANDWTQAMQWIEAHTDARTWVLAPPGHAWRYGTSVRVAAERDVFLEEAKDTAVAMYSRDAALVVLDRIRRANDFDTLTADSARSLAAATGLDILVTERTLALPILYDNARFHIYKLR